MARTESVIANNLREFSNDKGGIKKWFDYCLNYAHTHGGRRVTFDNESFKRCNFGKFQFSGINFEFCDLSECNFTEAKFHNCRFPPKGIDGVVFADASFDACEFINCNFKGAHLTGAQFNTGNCEGAVFSEASDLNGTTFSRNTKLSNSDFSGLDLGAMVIESGSLENANFEGVIFDDGTTFKDCNLNGAKFINSKLNNAKFLNCQIDHVDFTRATLPCARFELGNSLGVCFSKADLSDACFSSNSDIQIEKVSFNNAILSGAEFYSLRMERCLFSGCTLVTTNIYCCKFHSCDFHACTIDRLTLSGLEDQGVTRSDELAMKIKDDAASLRLHFGGIWSALHVLALLFFVTPYLWFVITHWPEAYFFTEAPEYHISLWKALSLYIYNGGVNIKTGEYSFHWSFLLFIGLLLFNTFRFGLLVKTKQLEHEKIVTGLPARFDFSDPVPWLPFSTWGSAFRWGRLFIFLSILLAMFNFWHFMGRVIPLDSL